MSDAVQALVVDDQEPLRLLLSHVIRLMGHSCDLAINGRECLLSIIKKPYDVVFLDLVLPEIDGETALRWIRTHAPETRVIITSIQDDDGIIQRMLSMGATAYLVKPFTVTEIKNVMQGILSRQQHNAPCLPSVSA